MAPRTTTGHRLRAHEALRGLLDHGLFSEKIPPCFSSVGLADIIPRRLLQIVQEADEKKLKKQIHARHDYARYESLRNVNVPRQMGVPHPESHVVQCLAIVRHWAKIKRHCAKPVTPVSRTYVRKTSTEKVFLMNYKGPFRFQNEEADIEAMIGSRYQVRADISSCFPSVYTHSIPWAIHGRNRAKANRSLLLPGNLLDTVSQNVRDGQTNGLLIGPHTSNVLAEVVLTRVDDELTKKGLRFVRHIDDYVYYAAEYSDAEEFIRELATHLRDYELSLNEKKTKVIPMPVPLEQDWVRALQLTAFPTAGKVRFSTVRTFMDSALRIAEHEGDSAVLNYAIRMIPDRLNLRAKRLFLKYVVNLAVLYPYLVPLFDEHVFGKHVFNGMDKVILRFVEKTLVVGVRRLYPDAVAHGLYYSIKFQLAPDIASIEDAIIRLDDCLTLVLLLEYGKLRRMTSLIRKIRRRANRLRGAEMRDKDRYWLLIYQVWSASVLASEGQTFLAELKRKGMEFIRF